ncbi:MAG: hypothetical protein ACI8RZ_005572 [Myxococcota bacterium]
MLCAERGDGPGAKQNYEASLRIVRALGNLSSLEARHGGIPRRAFTLQARLFKRGVWMTLAVLSLPAAAVKQTFAALKNTPQILPAFAVGHGLCLGMFKGEQAQGYSGASSTPPVR